MDQLMVDFGDTIPNIEMMFYSLARIAMVIFL